VAELPVLTLRDDHGVVRLVLNRPEQRNALDPELAGALSSAVESASADASTRVIVITGAGSAFCAGADLGNLQTATRESLGDIYEGFLRIARSPLPTLAAVNGAAVGAGMNLALGCDVRIASTRARFDTRFLQIGLHPGGGHTWMQLRTVGLQGALAAVVFGQVLDGAEAERVGLVYRCVAEDELLDQAQVFARGAASAPRELAIVTKRTIRDIGGVATHDAAVDRELEPQLWSVQQPWFAERIAALKARISSKR
jgi:enoyl-CoA hydratase